nr:hypothetical protein [Sphingopyxis sp. BSNA05]
MGNIKSHKDIAGEKGPARGDELAVFLERLLFGREKGRKALPPEILSAILAQFGLS